jgi:hypothetical protein
MDLRVIVMVNIFLKPNIHKAKSSSSKTYAESTLFTILPKEELLPEVEKKHYLDSLQEIVSLPEDYFKIIYEELIDNFALFVQVLPESYGEDLGGLLNDGLRRGLLAIRILKETSESDRHPLFLFAIYSIALLADLGQVLNYRIMISDEKGAFIDEWVPALGYMHEFGQYYKIRPYEAPATLVRSVTPLFGRQLLNDTAMTWLSSNSQIFDMWLAFLNQEEWSGGLGKILKVERKDFENKKEQIGLIPIGIPRTEPSETDLAEKFLAWIKSGLADGKISFNEVDSMVHVVRTQESDLSAFLQAPELFQRFTYEYMKTRRDWVGLCRAFNQLGLTDVSGPDLKIKQFFAEGGEAKSGKLGFLGQEKTESGKYSAQEKSVLSTRLVTTSNSIKEGIVVKNAKMLFGNKVQAASKFLRDIEMRWGHENSLPKAKQRVAHAPESKVSSNHDISPKRKN